MNGAECKPDILLLGGTSETADIATRLAAAGFSVLVSTATDEPLDIGTAPGIARRIGRLDETAMAALVAEQSIRAIVDASHPYASAAHATAARTGEQTGIPVFVYLRKTTIAAGDLSFRDFAANHEQAAKVAFAAGRPVLLTTGSTNLAPYVGESQRTRLPLIVRVLPRDDAIAACLRAGLPRERIIAAKGPFSVEVNRRHIRQFAAGVLVTKDSGQPGGVEEKLQAARLERCRVVVVLRPARPDADAAATFEDVEALVEAVRRVCLHG